MGRDYSEKDAERLIQECGPKLGLPVNAAELAELRKALLAAMLRRRTTVGFEWISTRLQMGHPGSVSRLVGKMKQERTREKRVDELEERLRGEDWS